MVNEQSWDEIKDSLKVGTKVTGIVIKHRPYGIFVELPGIKFKGLVSITNFSDEGRMTPSEYPKIGSSVDAIVLAFKETGKQIWLSMKPSKLYKSK